MAGYFFMLLFVRQYDSPVILYPSEGEFFETSRAVSEVFVILFSCYTFLCDMYGNKRKLFPPKV